ncbi:hypothetical protein ACL2XP_03880 [Sodalis sp. RH21]|uniref:hypothetical protein n=1 Tax=unclassified Sodalis (in: enterobacteria) TaxID=2636512 RepID=UPI0039B39ABB
MQVEEKTSPLIYNLINEKKLNNSTLINCVSNIRNLPETSDDNHNVHRLSPENNIIDIDGSDEETQSDQYYISDDSRASTNKKGWGWCSKLAALLGCIIGAGTLRYYVRFGQRLPGEAEWIAALPLREQQDARELITTINQSNASVATEYDRRNVSLTEAALRLFSTWRLTPQVLSGVFPYPECAKTELQRRYWHDLLQNKYDLVHHHAVYEGWMEVNNSSPPAMDSPVPPITNTDRAPSDESDAERNDWLHTVGTSREIPKLDHKFSVNFIDKIIQERLGRIFSITPTVKELERCIAVKLNYEIAFNNGAESFTETKYGNFSLRDILLRSYMEKNNNPYEGRASERTLNEIKFLNPQGKSRLSYLEFIANNEIITLKDELEHALNYFSNNQDIEDAYIKMAKNRLLIALFPIFAHEENEGVSQIVRRWIDGAINEKLVGLDTPDGEIIIPDIIALVEPVGGLLISLVTGAVYAWTPDDATSNLKNFLHQHLSIEQQKQLDASVLATSVILRECVFSPAINFKISDNLWQTLKNLNIQKLHKHIKNYTITEPSGDMKDPHHFAQEALITATVAVSLLVFFASGGSAAGCSAIMLTNVLAGGLSSALYADTALHATNKNARKQAWDAALLGVIMTGLGAAADIYNIAKSLNYNDYKTMFTTATAIKNIIIANDVGKPLALTAAQFIKADTRQRMVLLIESLLRNAQSHTNILGDNNIAAMLKIMKIAKHLNAKYYGLINEPINVNSLFKAVRTIDDRHSLSMISAGYNVAITDSKKERIKLLLLSLGEGKFAGFDLHDITKPAAQGPQWQQIEKNDFIFSGKKLTLRNGETAIVIIEDDRTALVQQSRHDIAALPEKLVTKFRRYCNGFQFDHNTHEILGLMFSFAKKHDFEEIKYRVLFIWSDRFDNIEQRHYLLAAKRKGISFVLDSVPENINYLNLPDMLDANILPEIDWTAGFEQSGTSALITYKDFEEEAAATNYHRVTDLQNADEQILFSPDEISQWQAPELMSDVIYSQLALNYIETRKQVFLLKTVRAAILDDHSSISSYEFILKILTKTGTLTQNQTDLLMSKFMEEPLSLPSFFSLNPKPISSLNDFLRVSPGKIVYLKCRENPAISHIVISIGNGRFAGMGHGIVNGALGNEKRIVMAEQLGKISDGIFYSYETELTYTANIAHPFGVETEEKTLYEIAIDTDEHAIDYQSPARFVMELLVNANKIVPQQAYALERLIILTFGNLDGNRISLTKLGKLLANSRYISSTSELESIAEGNLVIFYGENKDFHILLSLGNKRFAGVNNHFLNKEIPPNQLIITSRQVGEIVDGKMLNNNIFSSIITGDVNVEKTRISALLGPDSRLSYVELGPSRFSLEIKAHGAAASINHYDAIELSDIIDGFNLYLHPGKTIEHIDLISCYGGFGGRRSSAQIIADRLGATVEGYKGIVMDNKSMRRGKGIEFKPHSNYGWQRRKENERWHMRIHEFTEIFLGLWEKSFQTHRGRAISDEQPFSLIIIDIMHLLKNNIKQGTFILRYPGLVSVDTLSQAILILENDKAAENVITALLSIIYDNEQITGIIDAYMLLKKQKEHSLGMTVLNSYEMCKSFSLGKFMHPLERYKKLTPIISYSDINPGSNIYICYDGGRKNLFRESILRINDKCNHHEQWPMALANFISGYNQYLPIAAGVIDGEALSATKSAIGNFFYLNPLFEADFSIQITLSVHNSLRQNNPLSKYKFHNEAQTKLRNVDARDRLDFHAFVLHGDKLAVNVSNIFDSGSNIHSNHDDFIRPRKPLAQYIPRMLVTIMEEGERIILLQRNIPDSIKANNSAMAFFIAGEINSYTSLIKVGNKQGDSITPIHSDRDNYIYIDPDCVDTSWVSINFIGA